MRTFPLLTFVMFLLAASAARGDSITTGYIVTDLDLGINSGCINVELMAINDMGSVAGQCIGSFQTGIVLWLDGQTADPIYLWDSPWEQCDYTLNFEGLSENDDIVTFGGYEPWGYFGVLSPGSGWQLMDADQAASLDFGGSNGRFFQLYPDLMNELNNPPWDTDLIAGYLYTPVSKRAHVPEPASWVMLSSVMISLVVVSYLKGRHREQTHRDSRNRLVNWS